MVADALPEAIARALRDSPREWLQSACELRLRASGVTLCAPGAMRRLCDVGEDGMRAAMASLTRGNMHALGECVRQGYVPLPGGFRAGLCGRAIMRGGEVAGLEDVSGICIRITRMLPGASDGVMRHILHAGRARGALIVSAPGLGKTTLLRDIARNLSRAGLNVAVADERGELAGAGQDLGAHTDVMSLCPKAQALGMLVRALRPDALITDELGAPGDARAALDAARCGVAVIASAHAGDLRTALGRQELGEAISGGAFERIVVIGGPRPGEGVRVYDGKGRELC